MTAFLRLAGGKGHHVRRARLDGALAVGTTVAPVTGGRPDLETFPADRGAAGKPGGQKIYKVGLSGDATEMAQRATAEGRQLVIACGGDGTLNEVVNGLAEAQNGYRVPLGLLPGGTANILATRPAYVRGLRAPGCARRPTGAPKGLRA